MVQPWPEATDEKDPDALRTLGLMQDLISGIRNVKSEYGVSPGKEISAILNLPEDANGLAGTIDANRQYFARLARVTRLQVGSGQPRPRASASVIVGPHEVYIPLEGMIDLAVERERLQKKIADQERYLTSIERKLRNEQFVANAPAHVVEREREKAETARAELVRLRASLDDLR